MYSAAQCVSPSSSCLFPPSPSPLALFPSIRSPPLAFYPLSAPLLTTPLRTEKARIVSLPSCTAHFAPSSHAPTHILMQMCTYMCMDIVRANTHAHTCTFTCTCIRNTPGERGQRRWAVICCAAVLPLHRHTTVSHSRR